VSAFFRSTDGSAPVDLPLQPEQRPEEAHALERAEPEVPPGLGSGSWLGLDRLSVHAGSKNLASFVKEA